MTSTINIENITEPIKNSNHEDVQLNNQINTANHSDFNNDVEMENGHLTNGKCWDTKCDIVSKLLKIRYISGIRHRPKFFVSNLTVL